MCRNHKISQLNDQLRKHGLGGRVFITQGIQSLDEWYREAVINAVREFNAFTPNNDPYGEHDMGNVVVAGAKAMWKIDYYDPSMTVGSEEPADCAKTVRVLTIMLAEEY
ncbi:hypothetical protein BEN30_16090 [Magnetovibrio blakemorei]|uniref:DUF3768 domain-containing protein n=2 Tax=Magnetovibrio blakemorei TaxID=28181 RepID=A0A1E5Q4C9_9PROT|nr:hypothetical protein BEN30_16090 [Magnetovibrio blakemorei]